MKYTYEAEKRRFFETQILIFEDVVRGIAKGVLNNPDDVNDAVQDTFLAAWINLDQLAKRSSAGPWVKAIAKNIAVNSLRKSRREESISLNLPVMGAMEYGTTIGDILSDTGPGPEEICVIRAEQRSWYLAYSMLPDHYRLNLYLRYYMQMEINEVSSRMGISRQAHISACYRARKALRKNYTIVEQHQTGIISTSI